MAELCSRTHFSLAAILVLAGGVIPPAPAVPFSTRVSDRLKRVQEHSSPPGEYIAGMSQRKRKDERAPRHAQVDVAGVVQLFERREEAVHVSAE